MHSTFYWLLGLLLVEWLSIAEDRLRSSGARQRAGGAGQPTRSGGARRGRSRSADREAAAAC